MTLSEVKEAFWVLLSSDRETRCKAASVIANECLGLSIEEFSYLSKRLIHGMVSSVTGARESFTVALSGCLRKLSSTQRTESTTERYELLLDALRRTYDLDGLPVVDKPLRVSHPGGDARELALARLYAIGAVIGGLNEPEETSAPSIRLEGILNVLADLAEQDPKNLGEACGRLACEAVAKLVKDRGAFRSGTDSRNAVLRYWRRRQHQGHPSADALALALYCRHRFALRASEADCALWGTEPPCCNPEVLQNFVRPAIGALVWGDLSSIPRTLELLTTASVDGTLVANHPSRSRKRSLDGIDGQSAWVFFYEQIVAPHLLCQKHGALAAIGLKLLTAALKHAASTPYCHDQDWSGLFARAEWNECLWNAPSRHKKHATTMERLLRDLTEAILALLRSPNRLGTSLATALLRSVLVPKQEAVGRPPPVVIEACANILSVSQLTTIGKLAIRNQQFEMLVQTISKRVYREHQRICAQDLSKIDVLLELLAEQLSQEALPFSGRQRAVRIFLEIIGMSAAPTSALAVAVATDTMPKVRRLLQYIQRDPDFGAPPSLQVCMKEFEDIMCNTESCGTGSEHLALVLFTVLVFIHWGSERSPNAETNQIETNVSADSLIAQSAKSLTRYLENRKKISTGELDPNVDLVQCCLHLLRFDHSGVRRIVNVVFSSALWLSRDVASLVGTVLSELPGLEQAESSEEDLDTASRTSAEDTTSSDGTESAVDASDSEGKPTSGPDDMFDLGADMDVDLDQEDPAVLAAYDLKLATALEPMLSDRQRRRQSPRKQHRFAVAIQYWHRVLDLIEITIQCQLRSAKIAPVLLMDMLSALNHTADFVERTQGSSSGLYHRLVRSVLRGMQRVAAACRGSAEVGDVLLDAFQTLLRECVEMATSHPSSVRFPEHIAIALHAGIRLMIRVVDTNRVSSISSLIAENLLHPLLAHYRAVRGRVIASGTPSSGSVPLSALLTFVQDLAVRSPALFTIHVIDALEVLLDTGMKTQDESTPELRAHALLECWTVAFRLAATAPTAEFIDLDHQLGLAERWICFLAQFGVIGAGLRKALRISQPFLQRLEKEMETGTFILSDTNSSTRLSRLRLMVTEKLSGSEILPSELRKQHEKILGLLHNEDA
ncbi:hypothetical protein CCYA_CCYA07G2214 [Cyanidiococcus yangmingshanensis]|nr:hypothetical protein CCYA_CCYA07G2214 [Cyanidiococcus yangmingshanensis]